MLDLTNPEVYKKLSDDELEDQVEFIEAERNIQNLLFNSAIAAWSVAELKLNDYTRKSINSVSDLENALQHISPELSKVHTANVDTKYKDYVDNSMMKGSRDSGGGNAVLYALNRDAIRDGIVNSSKYYTNKFFNDQIIPSIAKGVDDIILKGADGRQIFNAVKDAIDDHYANVRYWNIVANVSASRSYNYGIVKGGTYAGYTQVMFDAILDNRTSKTCKHMSGRTWSIYKAIDHLEAVSMCPPEKLKELFPFQSFDAIKDLSDDELANAGVIAPPLHCRCRSVLKLIS